MSLSCVSLWAVSREPHLPMPNRYFDDPGSCHSFLSQCSLVFELQPSSFPSDRSRIADIITLTSRRALAWASAVWEQQTPLCFNLQQFPQELKVFYRSVLGREAARKLLCLLQGFLRVADYAIDFHMLAAESAWNRDALFDTFHHFLFEEEVASRELLSSLDLFIDLSICIDNRSSRRGERRFPHTSAIVFPPGYSTAQTFIPSLWCHSIAYAVGKDQAALLSSREG